MDTEYLVIDNNTQGQEVEHIGEVMPDIGVAVLAGALCIKTIGLRNAS